MFHNLDKPVIGVKETVEIFLNSYKKGSKYCNYLSKHKEKLIADELNYEKTYEEFKEKIDQIEPDECTKNCMLVIYKRQKLREFLYKKLIGENKYCCICGNVLIINQLDHVLPKAKFPQFSITPLNLVPICSDCNFYKNHNENGVAYNSYYQNNEELGNKLKSSYKLIIESGQIRFSRSKGTLTDYEEKVIKSYGIDERIKYRGKVILRKILDHIRFILKNMVEYSGSPISERTIEQILDSMNYDKEGIDSIFFKSIKDNKESITKYMLNQLGIKSDTISANRKLKIKKELSELEKEKNISKSNEHIINILALL